eukprot:Nk52_evm12s167 gene=Nk52_evmTU12s167
MSSLVASFRSVVRSSLGLQRATTAFARSNAPANKAVSGTIPTDEDQATGMERAEMELWASGDSDPFLLNPAMVDRIGTKENPIEIPSYESSRIVGTGTADGTEVHWLHVVEGELCRCENSGQVFKLKKLPTPAFAEFTSAH